MSAPSQILSVAKPPGAHTVQSLGPSLRALPYPRPLLPPGRAERAPGDPIAWESSLGSAGPVSPKRPGHVTALPCWHCSQAHRRPGPHGGGLQASCSACPRPHGRRMPLGPVPRPCPPWGHFDALRRLTLKLPVEGQSQGVLNKEPYGFQLWAPCSYPRATRGLLWIVRDSPLLPKMCRNLTHLGIFGKKSMSLELSGDCLLPRWTQCLHIF